jgi:hypothetical protein
MTRLDLEDQRNDHLIPAAEPTNIVILGAEKAERTNAILVTNNLADSGRFGSTNVDDAC